MGSGNLNFVSRAKVAKAEVDTCTALLEARVAGDREAATDAVWILRARGWTWAEIGEAVGISKSAAFQAWGHRSGEAWRRGWDWDRLAAARPVSKLQVVGTSTEARRKPSERSRSLAPASPPVTARRPGSKQPRSAPGRESPPGATDDPSDHAHSIRTTPGKELAGPPPGRARSVGS